MIARPRPPRLSLSALQDLRCILASARGKAIRERLVAVVEVARGKIQDFSEIGAERGAPGERHLVVPGLLVMVYRIGREGTIEVARVHRAGGDPSAG